MVRAFIETLRPKQWIKNLVIFAGLIFDGQLLVRKPLLTVFAAFLLFCLVSGITYTINDLMDLRSDRAHPIKKLRPIASGRLPINVAVITAILLSLIAFPCAFLLKPLFGLICVSYTLLMLAYSKWLKHIMLVDVLVIAIGFVIRVVAGISVITVKFFSPWLLILTTFLALYLGFGKRLSELKLLQQSAGEHRKVLEGYTVELLNQFLVVITSAILITYVLYTFNAHLNQNQYVSMATIPFVLYGIFRYTFIIQTSTAAGSPEEVLLHDRPLQFTILLWGILILLNLYLLV
ncbi:MAG TPA: decaprenyl-phosphate phosphoribosyltransferase [Anaerolineaceae bacterium]|nr:decaprenyl-phosphate phosphoribosyltransferase [Anaerolineaceae bacterium]